MTVVLGDRCVPFPGGRPHSHVSLGNQPLFAAPCARLPAKEKPREPGEGMTAWLTWSPAMEPTELSAGPTLQMKKREGSVRGREAGGGCAHLLPATLPHLFKGLGGFPLLGQCPRCLTLPHHLTHSGAHGTGVPRMVTAAPFQGSRGHWMNTASPPLRASHRKPAWASLRALELSPCPLHRGTASGDRAGEELPYPRVPAPTQCLSQGNAWGHC